MSNDINPFRPQHNRRDLLTKGVTGALGLATLSAKGTVLAWNMIDPTPGVTEGPYWVGELLLRFDIRKDPVTGIVQIGLPFFLLINVVQLKNNKTTPLPGAMVDIWHCNVLGVYSDEAVRNTLGEKFLRGLQVINVNGTLNFVTVYPGWYHGRTVHIHIRVRVVNTVTKTITYNFVSQMFFDDTISNKICSTIYNYTAHPNRDTLNTTDGIFTGPSEDGEVKTEAGQHLLLQLSRAANYATDSFTIALNLTDTGYNNPPG
jgi:protocatechuate 3,4-dioxygenase beta subunit